MREKIIFGILSLTILTACQQNDEFTEIETIENTKESINPNVAEGLGGNTKAADLTFEDGTPVDYTIAELEVVVVYEPGATEAQKAQVRSNNATEFGPVQVVQCSLNSNAETWIYTDLIIHNLPYEVLNQRATEPIEDDDIVQKAKLTRINYQVYEIDNPNIICN